VRKKSQLNQTPTTLQPEHEDAKNLNHASGEVTGVAELLWWGGRGVSTIFFWWGDWAEFLCFSMGGGGRRRPFPNIGPFLIQRA
jgi:hypothetical protein